MRDRLVVLRSLAAPASHLARRGARVAVPALVLALLSVACGSGGGSAELPPSDGRPEIAIGVDGEGYHPAEASAAPGAPVRLVFTRTSDEGCGQQLVFPDLDIRRDLPLDQPVAVDLTMPASGAVRFSCGMDMYRGSIVAR